MQEIRKRGALRVGALGEFPWLRENPGNTSQPFTGPAWELANDYAKRLGVRLEVVCRSATKRRSRSWRAGRWT